MLRPESYGCFMNGATSTGMEIIGGLPHHVDNVGHYTLATGQTFAFPSTGVTHPVIPLSSP